MTHRWRLSALVFGVGLTLLATSSLTSVLQARATVTTVASGLVNPRGLNFGPDGALYVAEAGSGGSGPCILGSDGLVKCYGTTGAVTKIVLGGPPSRVVTGLPSIAALPGTMGAGIATGPHDVDFQGLGNGYVTIGFGRGSGQAAGSGVRAVGSQIRPVDPLPAEWQVVVRRGPCGLRKHRQPRRRRRLRTPIPTACSPGPAAQSTRTPAAIRSTPSPRMVRFRTWPCSHAAQRRSHPSRRFRPRSPSAPTETLYVGQLTGGPFPVGAAACLARTRRTAGVRDGLPDRLHEDHRHRVRQRRLALRARDQRGTGAGAPPFGPPGALFRIPPGGGTPVNITPTVPGVGIRRHRAASRSAATERSTSQSTPSLLRPGP